MWKYLRCWFARMSNSLDAHITSSLHCMYLVCVRRFFLMSVEFCSCAVEGCLQCRRYACCCLRANSGYLVHCSPDVFSDDEIGSLNVNACKELTKVQKMQSHWCKPSKNHDKLPNNYVNLPRKAHMYRIQQPRTVM